MENGRYDNNKVALVGVVCKPLTYSHRLNGEAFYQMALEVARLSGLTDILPITISERLMRGVDVAEGEMVGVQGQIRSYNKMIDGISHLVITVFARTLVPSPVGWENPNMVTLDGFICRQPTYRMTPFMREITDLLLAINRPYNKSDYIPAIAWGRNARFAQSLKVGDRVILTGRMQSREYQKKGENEDVITKIAYEVSISAMECPNNAEPMEEEQSVD